MRQLGFTSTLVFGALVAALTPAVVALELPLRLYLLGVAVLYLLGLAGPGRRLRVGGFALGLAALVGLASPGLAGTAVGAAWVVAAVRGFLLSPASRGWTLLAETGLGFAGLGAARWLAAPDPVSLGLALWAYFLVQSPWQLGVGAGAAPATALDPFDEAARRAEALLDEA